MSNAPTIPAPQMHRDCVDPLAREMAVSAQATADEAKEWSREALDDVRDLSREMVAVRASMGTLANTALRIEQRIANRLGDPQDTDITARHKVPSSFPPARVVSFVERFAGHWLFRLVKYATVGGMALAGEHAVTWLLSHH